MPVAAKLEGGDHRAQRLGFLLEIARDLGALLGERRILLRDLVHMGDGAGHLVDAVGLLGRRLRDLARAELEVAIQRAALGEARHYKAISSAEGMFRGCLNKNFPDLEEANANG